MNQTHRRFWLLTFSLFLGIIATLYVSIPSAQGRSWPSSRESSQVRAAGAPATPTGLKVYSGNLENYLYWQANKERDLAGYNIYRSSSQEGPYVKINSEPFRVPTYVDASFKDPTNPTPMGIYYYQITAVDKRGNESGRSSPVDSRLVWIVHLFLPDQADEIKSSNGQLKFSVPAGSLLTMTLVAVTTDQSARGAPRDRMFITPRFRWEPSGLQFIPDNPALMTLSYAVPGSFLPDYVSKVETGISTPGNTQMLYLNETTGNWEETTMTIDSINKTISSPITHFTTYGGSTYSNPHGKWSSLWCYYCHNPHLAKAAKLPKEKDVCYQCHGGNGDLSYADKSYGAGSNYNAQGDFGNYTTPDTISSKSSIHKIPDQQQECSDCHNPHASTDPSSTTYVIKLLRLVNADGTQTHVAPASSTDIAYKFTNPNDFCGGCHGATPPAQPDNNGYVLSWLLRGTWTGSGTEGGLTSTDYLSPETEARPNPGEPRMTAFVPASMKWKTFASTYTNGFVDLLAAYPGSSNQEAYAFAYIYSPASQNVDLKVGSAAGIRVWLNGIKVSDNNIERLYTPDQDTISGLTLKQGWNKMLVRVGQRSDITWGFGVRFMTAGTSTPVTNLYISNVAPTGYYKGGDHVTKYSNVAIHSTTSMTSADKATLDTTKIQCLFCHRAHGTSTPRLTFFDTSTDANGYILYWDTAGYWTSSSTNGGLTTNDYLNTESSAAPIPGDATAVGSKTWKIYQSYMTDGFADLKSAFNSGSTGSIEGYAFVYIKSLSQKTVDMAVGSQDGIRVWLNGIQVLNQTTAQLYTPNQWVVSNLTLYPGYNRLLVKVGHVTGTNPWGFGIRFLEPGTSTPIPLHVSVYGVDTPATGYEQENLCYQCHTSPQPNTSGGTNPYNVFTGYVNSYSAGYVTIRHHPVDNARDQANGTRVVECVSCHDVHVVNQTNTTTTSKIVDPANTKNLWIIQSDVTAPDYNTLGIYIWCEKCHVNATTTQPIITGFAVPYTIKMVNDADYNNGSTVPHDSFRIDDGTFGFNNSGGKGDAHGARAGNPTFRPGSKYYAGYPPMPCTDCHDFHGTSNAWNLRETINDGVSSVTVTGITTVDDGKGKPNYNKMLSWCRACHTQSNMAGNALCTKCHRHSDGGRF